MAVVKKKFWRKSGERPGERTWKPGLENYFWKNGTKRGNKIARGRKNRGTGCRAQKGKTTASKGVAIKIQGRHIMDQAGFVNGRTALFRVRSGLVRTPEVCHGNS